MPKKEAKVEEVQIEESKKDDNKNAKVEEVRYDQLVLEAKIEESVEAPQKDDNK